MKFSSQDIDILKHFSNVCPSLLFQKGTHIISRSGGNLYIQYELSTPVEKEFVISDVSKLINCLKLVDNEDIEIKDSHLIISNKWKEIKFFTHAREELQNIFDKKLKEKKYDINFSITKEQFKDLMDASRQMNLSNIEFVGSETNQTLYAKAIDKVYSGKSSNAYCAKIGEWDGKDFSVTYPEHMSVMMVDSYDIQISDTITKLSSKSLPLSYITPPYQEN